MGLDDRSYLSGLSKIMVKLPDADRDEITDAIFAVAKAEHGKQFSPLGISVGVAGDNCPRRLWYGVRWVMYQAAPTGRMARIFARGDIEEHRIVAELRAIGCILTTLDEDGKQFKIRLLNGWIRGRVDGIIHYGVPGAMKSKHVLEIKTANDKAWKRVFNHGIEKAEPKHYAQVQLAMHAFKIKRGLYISVNKNDENIHSERVRYDRDLCETLVGRAGDIAHAPFPPLRPFKSQNKWPCSLCEFNAVCWSRAPVRHSCRTCRHGTMELPDALECAKRVGFRDLEQQRAGCDQWQPLKALSDNRKKDDGLPF